MPFDLLYVLLVEDNDDDEQLTMRAIKHSEAPCFIKVAHDGAEALEVLLKEDERLPDLILLDLKLPKVSGLEVLKHLRANKRTSLIPTVVLSSSDEMGDIESSYHLGASSYVRKPIDFEEYVDCVSQICHYWLILNRFSLNSLV